MSYLSFLLDGVLERGELLVHEGLELLVGLAARADELLQRAADLHVLVLARRLQVAQVHESKAAMVRKSIGSKNVSRAR